MLKSTPTTLGRGLRLRKALVVFQFAVSIGLLIATGFDYMLTGNYWISMFPGIALLITIFSINLVGDQLRDVLNPRLQK